MKKKKIEKFPKILNLKNERNNKDYEVETIEGEDELDYEQYEPDQQDEEVDNEDEEEADYENYLYDARVGLEDTMRRTSRGDESLNESIMNWSMKISNYGSETGTGVGVGGGGGGKYRSQSRSPDALLQTSLNVARARHSRHQAGPKCVTSWGQLKHSKSSSSQLGSPLETSRAENAVTQTTHTQTSPVPGPQPLYKLFQTSRSNITAAEPLIRSSRRDILDEQIAPQHRQQSNALVIHLFVFLFALKNGLKFIKLS